MSRSRWAAIGAAVAVTLGAGGIIAVEAASSESVFVPITPTRVLDTRTDVGLPGKFISDAPRLLDVTGTIQTIGDNGSIVSAAPVPDGATAIVANITAVLPSTRGFVSVRPGTSSGLPSTSNLNFSAGQVVPNSVTVELPTSGATAGQIQLWFHGNASATTDLLVDIVGYYTESTGTGPAGPSGPQGPSGPAGPSGPQGPSGVQIGPATNTALDTTGITGRHTSITVGTNGNPIISYWDSSAGDLNVAVCNDPTCTAATITALDTAGNTGQYTSITIGTNGNPIISYFDETAGDLNVAACTNPTCTAATITALDTDGNTGLDTSITIGTNGNPIISYNDDTVGDLNVAACNDPTCTAATITPLDTDGNNGVDTSITIGTNGNPIISYHDFTDRDLNVYACGNTLCNPHIKVGR